MASRFTQCNSHTTARRARHNKKWRKYGRLFDKQVALRQEEWQPIVLAQGRRQDCPTYTNIHALALRQARGPSGKNNPIVLAQGRRARLPNLLKHSHTTPSKTDTTVSVHVYLTYRGLKTAHQHFAYCKATTMATYDGPFASEQELCATSMTGQYISVLR